MRYAHVCRDGYRVICSVEGCGERLGRIFEHSEYGGRVFEFAGHMVFDGADQVWRPTRFYQRRGVPFRRASRHRADNARRKTLVEPPAGPGRSSSARGGARLRRSSG